MGRCGCASDRCDCVIKAGNWITIYGSGSASNPYVVEGTQPIIEVEDGGGTGGTARLVGEVITYAGDTDPAKIPAGWVLCDGRALSRGLYSALFSALGVAYGAGDGVNTFNIPNYTGRVGKGASPPTEQRGQGQNASTTRTLNANNIPLHSHNANHGHPATSTGGSSVGAPRVVTETQGAHEHSVHLAGSVGGGNSVTRGAGSGSGSFATQDSSGSHYHGVTVPDHTHGTYPIPATDFNVSNYGKNPPDAFNIEQPYVVENRLIWTGVI